MYKNGTLNPATTEPLGDLGLNIDFSTYPTDTSGLLSASFLSSPVNVDVPLQGLWSTVFDVPSGIMPDFTDFVSTPTSTYVYPTTAPCSDRNLNAYYHGERVQYFMKGYFHTFMGMYFSLPTMLTIPAATVMPGTAVWISTSLPPMRTCPSFAEIGDIIYHEYGHGITDHFYTDLTGSSTLRMAP